MCIIFDLDQTLINSKISKELRSSRKWSEVYKLIPDFNVYEGIDELFKLIENLNIKKAIVTSSPKSYCSKIVDFFNWEIDYMVCYHDTERRKPYPDPIEKVIETLGGHIILSLGDDKRDIIASKAAGAISVACTWDTDNENELLSAKPDYVCSTVYALIDLIKDIFSNKSNKPV